jgi:hypothetical protein
MAEIWFGIGDHEVQLDLRGPGLILVMPKPGVLNYGEKQLQPSGEDDETWEFDLAPSDRGELCDSFRSWEYSATFLWEDPETEETIGAELKLSICRDEEDGAWGACLYPEGSPGVVLVVPDEVAAGLEEAFDSLPLEDWSFTPYIIEGGLKEEAEVVVV